MHHAAGGARRRPRPVADAPRAEGAAVARAWLLELIAAAPLELLPALPAADLAREAPALCGAVLAALRDDEALERLGPGGELEALTGRAGRLAGATTPAATAAAVESLRAAAWAVLWDELRSPPPALVADLSARLSHVCAVLGQQALGSLAAHAAAPASAPAPAHAPSPAPQDAAPSEPSAAAQPLAGAEPPPGLFVVTDARGATVAQPWLVAIERRLERHRTDRSPFAVLAIEVDDVERIVTSERGSDVATAIQEVERAICGSLRPADMLVRESLGRYWIMAPDTDPAGARALGERIADATGDAPQLHGAPLTVSIGLASCPLDAEDAASLAGRADEGVFAARAAGVRLA